MMQCTVSRCGPPFDGRGGTEIDHGAIEELHEILGLHAQETDAVVIIDAARTKLRAIRVANGSEVAVRRLLEALIIRARDHMLAQARKSMMAVACRRTHASEPA